MLLVINFLNSRDSHGGEGESLPLNEESRSGTDRYFAEVAAAASWDVARRNPWPADDVDDDERRRRQHDNSD